MLVLPIEHERWVGEVASGLLLPPSTHTRARACARHACSATTLLGETATAEVDRFKQALRDMHKKKGRDVVFYERYLPSRAGHVHGFLEAVPCDAKISSSLQVRAEAGHRAVLRSSFQLNGAFHAPYLYA